jgi:exopolyphosphatase / guanosine-5'-triphosphate,3'-diphosphate pyrophosphatase
VDRAEITRLGEGLDTGGQLAEEPMRRTVDAIAGMAAEAAHNEVAAIAAVGTAGLRIAPNRQALVDAVRARTGIAIEVIPGEQEARLAYLAATSELHVASGSLAVFDTGGGSSQFTFGGAGHIDEQFSVNVGAARFTERYGLDKAVTAEALAAVRDHIARDLSRLDGREPPAQIVGMGGAVTNLAAVKRRLDEYDPDLIQGTILDVDEIDRQIAEYRERDADARRDIVGLQPARAAVILAGACIVRTILVKLDGAAFVVSDRALRHGLLRERFGPRVD